MLENVSVQELCNTAKPTEPLQVEYFTEHAWDAHHNVKCDTALQHLYNNALL